MMTPTLLNHEPYTPDNGSIEDDSNDGLDDDDNSIIVNLTGADYHGPSTGVETNHDGLHDNQTPQIEPEPHN